MVLLDPHGEGFRRRLAHAIMRAKTLTDANELGNDIQESVADAVGKMRNGKQEREGQ